MTTVYSDVNMFVNTNNKGTVVYNADVIKQSIYNILTTPIGTRYREPLYGSFLPFLLQQQLTPDLVYSAKGYSIQALQRWEPRIVLIEEQVVFEQTEPTTIVGTIPFYIPQINVNDVFNAAFTQN